MSTIQPEISAIGFDNTPNTLSTTIFQLFGEQSATSWSSIDYNSGYSVNDDWVYFSIPVGDYFTGQFYNLVFINDDDDESWTNNNNEFSNSSFRNIKLTESAPVPEPSTILLLGSGLFGLAWYNLKRKNA